MKTLVTVSVLLWQGLTRGGLTPVGHGLAQLQVLQIFVGLMILMTLRNQMTLLVQ